MRKKYVIEDKKGHRLKTGMFTEPEVRMAAKAGLRVFEVEKGGDDINEVAVEITQRLTGLFDQNSQDEKNFFKF